LISLHVHVVDDSPGVTLVAKRVFREYLSRQKDAQDTVTLGPVERFDVTTFSSPAAWLRRKQSVEPDICLLDLSMDGDDEAGFKLARIVRDRHPQAVIVMFSGYDDAETVLRFKAAGASGFISKKTDMADVPAEVMQLYRLFQRRHGDPQLPPSFEGRFAGGTMRTIARRAPLILNSPIRAVLVSGETGTGKEVVADIFEAALHAKDAGRPFVRVNCGAITPSLLESELFGHAKGAFTGAQSARRGHMESADGGWIFLDEVASLTLPAQVALLRVIENQEVTPVGESKPRRINVRVLSACNEDLEVRVQAGTFRRDLWQRLRETVITLPAMRHRKDEIPALAKHFCKAFGEKYQVTPAALELLCLHDWADGNVRELRNCLRSMTEEAVSRILGPNNIPEDVFSALLLKGKSETHTESSRFRVVLEAEHPFPTPCVNTSCIAT